MLAMSPSQGRLSPERVDRPLSPTKGLGGFVQSAMLKRSDSVNKRWSAQAGPGLNRGNSIASNRIGYEGPRYPVGGISPLKELRPTSTSREGSIEFSSRPGSSQSNATLTRDQNGSDRPNTAVSLASNHPEPVDNEIARSKRVNTQSPPLTKQDEVEPLMSPPASPSKKWSPTKASWLENAINKPDSPKIKSVAPHQPTWMAEINRAKQQKESVDSSKEGSLKDLTIGRLIRSPLPGADYRPQKGDGILSGSGAGETTKIGTNTSADKGQRTGSPRTKKDPQIPSPSDAEQLEEPRFGVNPAEPAAAVEKPAASPPGKQTFSSVGPRVTSPMMTKAKPRTLTKQPAESKSEPEFKNVFGKLKRTQIQKYVAPDELKDNILSGKAGLSLTGGPKRADRKDEFRESILKKKEGMMAPSASTRIISASSKLQEQSTPEAIARRNGLTRSESIFSNGREAEKETRKPEALARLQHLRDKPKPTPPEKQPSAPATIQKESGSKASLGRDFPSSLAGMLQRGPSPLAIDGKPDLALSSNQDLEIKSSSISNDKQAGSVGPQLTHVTKARARGPKRRLPTASQEDRSADSPPLTLEVQPMRNLPGTKPMEFSKPGRVSAVGYTKPDARPPSNITNNNINNRKVSQPFSPRKPSTSVAQSLDAKASSPVSFASGRDLQVQASPTIKTMPVVGSKDGTTPKATVPTKDLGPLPDTPLQGRNVDPEPQFDSFKPVLVQGNLESEPQELDRPTPSVKGAAAIWGLSPRPVQSIQPKAPVKLPTRKDEELCSEEASLKPKEPVGLGIHTSLIGLKVSSEPTPPSSATPSPRSPPLPGKKPASIMNRITSNSLPPAATTPPNKLFPTKDSDVLELFARLFDEPPNSKTDISIDTPAILGSRSTHDNSQKIKTLRKQIFEIGDNGKSLPVPAHQEHILFEDCIYLCTHIFGNFSGTRTTEVYLWFGDGAYSSSREDAQLFAKKVSRDNNGKLIILNQGKETTNFFQALGGIVITRRGPSSRADSTSGSAATYILCGRQHLGQITFDEVDFSPRSLCKGFPYIVSARSGKLYLWKGSGSGADELGCARLIGMDLGLTGEIEEVDEGREPDAFWKLFPGGKQDSVATEGTSAQHWHLKPSCEKYTNRLYRIEVEIPRPKSNSSFSSFMQWGRRGSAPSDTNTAATAQFREVVPFAQSDLEEDRVCVLDAFFEIFM